MVKPKIEESPRNKDRIADAPEITDSKEQAKLEQLFIDSPGDLLCKTIANELRKVKEWNKLFGKKYIDSYKRMDYGIRSLPALRLYNETSIKTFDSWFINGDITVDLILPGSLRRDDLETIPGQISNALLQQFRRPKFFMILKETLPGLNELGKEFRIDKSLGFEVGDDIVPLTQMTVNFRIDLREWDRYLTRS
jgi:hypothetical protein